MIHPFSMLALYHEASNKFFDESNFCKDDQFNFEITHFITLIIIYHISIAFM